ncbi:MAG: hypothetical protein KC478_09625 [Bacteriovoracaceae bacterium]|nr:hypothetical protein [Bacteriovoracaceae bacterium]
MLSVKTIFIFSQALLAAGNWALLSYLARNFPVEATGEYNLVLATLSPIFIFFSLHLKNHYLSEPKSSFPLYVATRSLSLIAILVLAFVVGSWMGIVNQFFWGVFLLKTSEVLFELPFMYEHKKSHLGLACTRHIIRTVFVYSLLIYMLESGQGVIASFALPACLSVVATIFYIKFKTHKDDWGVKVSEIVELCKITAPLGGGASLLSLNVSLPRIYLAFLLGKEATAVYSVSFAFYSVWQLFFNSYLNALLPKFRSITLKEKLLIPLVLFGIGAIVFSIFDEYLYITLFGASYSVATELTPGLLISILLSFFSSFLFYEFLSRGEYKVHFFLNFLALLANGLMLAPLIMGMGIAAAYYAWAIAVGVQCMLYLWKLRRIENA